MALKRLRDGAHRLAPVARFLGGDAETDKRRRVLNPLRRLYNTKQWRQLRWSVLVAARFTCAQCGRIEADTARLVADHIRPHRGDEGLFWDRGNLQCLCQACHSGGKQRAEQPTRQTRGGVG